MKRILFALSFILPSVVYAGPDPKALLELVGYSYSDSVGVKAQRYRGDPGELEAVKSGDALFYIKGYGYNGSSMVTTPKASVTIKANQDWSTTANGSKVVISGTPDDSTTALDVATFGDFDKGYVVCHETFLDPIAVDSNTFLSAIDVTTVTLAAMTTTYGTADFTIQPIHPRNISFVLYDSGSDSTGTVTITGTNANGDTATETLAFNGTTDAGGAVVSTNAYANLTSIQITYTGYGAANTEKFWVGTSTGIGLANDVYKSANVFKVVENGVNVASGYTINPTYDTYLPASAPDATKDFSVWYRAVKTP